MLSKEEWRYLFILVRRALKEVFNSKKIEISPPPKDNYPHLYERRGVFVTLLKKEEQEGGFSKGELRGCIGSIFPEKPLYEEIIEVALSSAFRDPRFPPLKKEELEEIEIEISLLSPLKRASIEEIEVGKHGIYIKKGFYRGLLLPQVAIEYKCDRETFLRHTCLKAGLSEDCYLDPEVEIYLFTAEVCKESELIC